MKRRTVRPDRKSSELKVLHQQTAKNSQCCCSHFFLFAKSLRDERDSNPELGTKPNETAFEALEATKAVPSIQHKAMVACAHIESILKRKASTASLQIQNQ